MNPQVKEYLDNLDFNRNNHTRLNPDKGENNHNFGKIFYEEEFDRTEFLAELERLIEEGKIIGTLPEVSSLLRLNKNHQAYITKIDNAIETIKKRAEIEDYIETSYLPNTEIEQSELRTCYTAKQLNSTAGNIAALKQNCTHISYSSPAKQHSLDSWAEVAESKKENRMVTTLEFYKHKPSNYKHNQTQM